MPVNEVEDFGARKVARLSAFEIDKRTGSLRLLNQQPSLVLPHVTWLSIGRADLFW